MLQRGACLLPALQGMNMMKAFRLSREAGDDPEFQLDIASVFNLELLEEMMTMATGLAKIQDMIYHDFTPASRAGTDVIERYTASMEQMRAQQEEVLKYFTSLPSVCNDIVKLSFKIKKYDIYQFKQKRQSRLDPETGTYTQFVTGDLKISDIFGETVNELADKAHPVASEYRRQRMREVSKLCEGLVALAQSEETAQAAGA